MRNSPNHTSHLQKIVLSAGFSLHSTARLVLGAGSILAASSVLVTTGCGNKDEKKDDKKDDKKNDQKDAQKPEEKKDDKQAAGADAANAANAANVVSNCVGALADQPAEAFEVGGKKLERKGSVVQLATADQDDEFVIGQITDIKDHGADNSENLKQMIAWFKQEHVDAITITGDLGDTTADIEAVLRDVAPIGVPVLAIIGNRECSTDFTTAVGNVQKEFKNIINMNEVRVFNADDVSIVSLPGYHNKNYLHCAEGCLYGANHVQDLSNVAAKATGPVRVLISHGPPMMSGGNALDRIPEGTNEGSKDLAAFMKANSALFPFGLFGNFVEAGRRATNLTGDQTIAPEQFVGELYMNPGPADRVSIAQLDKNLRGVAGLLHVKGKQAKYKLFSIPVQK